MRKLTRSELINGIETVRQYAMDNYFKDKKPGLMPTYIADWLIENQLVEVLPESDRVIDCNYEWHNITYEEYCQKHGAYPRSCPLCHSFYSKVDKATNQEATIHDTSCGL